MQGLQPRSVLIITGGARGVDHEAAVCAKAMGLDQVVFPANWMGRKKGAGPFRNKLMLQVCKPDVVWAWPVPDGRGTQNMMREARERGISVIDMTEEKE